MRHRLAILILCLFNCIGILSAQNAKVAILSVNDLHSAIDRMPKLTSLADSLRGIYPELILVSAGDNCTGNPINDQYPHHNYPMTALMNYARFDVSAVGNHEFDGPAGSFKWTQQHSHFPYICANVSVADSLGHSIAPYKIFDLSGGVKVCFLSVVGINASGIPDAHPDKLKGMHFNSELETIRQYKSLRDSCNVLIFLTHIGYDKDLALSDSCNFEDAIIGGHSHTLINGAVKHNNVPITQVENGLKHATLTVFDLKDGKVERSDSKLFTIAESTDNESAASLLQFFTSANMFNDTIAFLPETIEPEIKLGELMCNAFINECNADFSIQNFGSVRVNSLAKGYITKRDILTLDPFGDYVMTWELKPSEIEDLIMATCHADKDRMPFVQGKKLNKNKLYKVALTDFITSSVHIKTSTEPQTSGKVSSDIIIEYLKHLYPIK